MRIALFLAATVIANLPARVHASTETPAPGPAGDAVVFAAGRYHCDGWIPQITSDSLRATLIGACHLLESGSVIRPEPGNIFGCHMTMPGVLGTGMIVVEHQWRFPAPGIQHPVTGEYFRVSNGTYLMPAGGDYQNLYRFDYPGELVEGVWMFEARLDGRAVASCCFNVTSAPGAVSSSPVAACSTPTS